jgi:glutathione S-transferase
VTLTLADSNAIMVYLARRYAAGSSWLPEDALGVGIGVQRWLSIAAGEVMYGPASARALAQCGTHHATPSAPKSSPRACSAFMDAHLSTQAFLAAPHATIADLACYAYVRHAPEGGITARWLCRRCTHGWRGSKRCPASCAMPTSPMPS